METLAILGNVFIVLSFLLIGIILVLIATASKRVEKRTGSRTYWELFVFVAMPCVIIGSIIQAYGYTFHEHATIIEQLIYCTLYFVGGMSALIPMTHLWSKASEEVEE